MAALPNFFEYYDPNQLLHDLYSHKKEQNSSFTLQFIAERAGIKSTGNLTDMLTGKAKIPARLVQPLAEVFELKKLETRYFAALVDYRAAKTHIDKTRAFDLVLDLKKDRTKNLDLSQYEYFSRWYYVAIRELLRFYRFKGDFSKLAKRIHPTITPAQAKRAIHVLEKTGLIKQGPDGWYEQAEINVTTGPWKSLAIGTFQRDTLDLAKQAFDTVPKELRSISTVTLGISEGSMGKVKEEIRACREKLLEIARQDEFADSVYHVAFCAFPMTRSEGGDTDE